jgi:hypothetical protein
MKTKFLILCCGLGFLFAVVDSSFSQEQPAPRLEGQKSLQPKKPVPAFPMDEAGFSPAAEKEALEYIRQSNPKAADELESIKRERPEIYFGRLKQVLMLTYQLEMALTEKRGADERAFFERAQALAAAEQRQRESLKIDLERLRREERLRRAEMDDPARVEREKKIAEFERQSRELAGSYSKAPDEAARKTLRANLAEIVTQLFDLREQNRQEEVKRMEADLKRLKDTLEQRQKNRANIIERRIQQLTGEAGAMEWE